jgi:membrane-bound lytic murein transglycosylase D
MRYISYLLLLTFLIFNISCTPFIIQIKKDKKTQKHPDSKNQEFDQEKYVYEAMTAKEEEESTINSSEIIDISQEYFENAIYKIQNDDPKGAVDDLETAFFMLSDCEFPSDQKMLAKEITEDIVNQLASLLYNKLELNEEGDSDSGSVNYSNLTSKSSNILDFLTTGKVNEKMLGIDKSFNIPVEVNERVLYFISSFANDSHNIIQSALDRSEQYIPHLKNIFAEKDLPTDLCYLPIVESAFKVKALSTARASGLWQFMVGTGSRYGLERNSFVDERFDPIKSTIAASEYLQELYAMFNDWYLALASYNVGENKIIYAIKQTGITDFWELSKTNYLPNETKDFVPRFLASLLIAKNPEKFGFNKPSAGPLTYEYVELNKPISLKLVARYCDIPLEDLKHLNPELRTDSTPPNISSYELRLPIGKKEVFLARYDELKDRGYLSQFKHKVEKGETLNSIAKRYNITLSSLIEANGIKNTRNLKVNRTLVIPTWAGEYSEEKDSTKKEKKKTTEFIVHKVRNGDTLYKIALKYNVDVNSINIYNNIKQDSLLYPGKILKIPTNQANAIVGPKEDNSSDDSSDSSDNSTDNQKEGTIIYEVKHGDSYYSIAKKFNCSTEDLKKWNNIKSKKYIHPGDKLYIYN